MTPRIGVRCKKRWQCCIAHAVHGWRVSSRASACVTAGARPRRRQGDVNCGTGPHDRSVGPALSGQACCRATRQAGVWVGLHRSATNDRRYAL